MRTVSSIIRRVMSRSKKATGTRVTQKQVKGPGVNAYKPRRAR
jgi:hypothetical protein